MNKILAPIVRDKSIYIVALIICSVTYVICHVFHAMQYFDLLTYVKFMLYALGATGALYFICYYLYLLCHLKPNPSKLFIEKFKYFFSYKHEMINMILLFVALSLVLSCFTSLKTAISIVNPYYLDPLLSQFDKITHFGYYPWEITHTLFKSPWVSAFVNFFYNIWIFIIWIFFVFATCQLKHPVKREQIIISVCLVWFVVGGLIAILLSSGGPVYAHRLFPNMTAYEDLMSLLHQQNEYLIDQKSFFTVWSLHTQEFLWNAYASQSLSPGIGISAMPSVHVSSVTLIALSITKLNKKWGIVAWLYVAVIFFGSIHLGWHYACDGYLGALITFIIWKSVGLWQRRYSKLMKSES